MFEHFSLETYTTFNLELDENDPNKSDPGEKAPKLLYKSLAMLQNTKFAVLPIHTKGEQKLFNHLMRSYIEMHLITLLHQIQFHYQQHQKLNRQQQTQL
jgi:hypothetical protein